MKDVVLKYKTEKECLVREALQNELKISSRLLRKLKLNKRILCNGKEAWANDMLKPGDELTVNVAFEENSDKIIAQEKKLDILYEDDCLLIVNKPGDLVVHPTCLHPEGTLANYVKYYLESKGEHVTTRFVNRLDRGTSGAIVFAKNDYTQECLVRQMKVGIFEKEYIAIVNGIVENDKGTIDMPIKRETDSIITRTVAPDGEKAITHYEVIKRFDNMTSMKFRLETGRTHQIRVHCKAIGHPIVGDGLYSDIQTNLINRQALHAYRIKFIHPITNIPLEVVCYDKGDVSFWHDFQLPPN